MRALAPLELIAAHKWRRATFTTYGFSAAFAEAVVIEALMRQGTSDIAILADQMGYKMALRERGAVRIGREYVVHPVAVTGGCFHPKLIVLEADDATHVLIGSGNLTYGGWTANLECIDHVHTNGMARAVSDVGRFFAALADPPRCAHGAGDHCRALSARLGAAAERGRDDGRVRVIDSLTGPLLDTIAEAAAELGGASRLAIVSPYWDSEAVDAIAVGLSLAECAAHVPRNAVPAPAGMDWPRDSKRVKPVEIDAMSSTEKVGSGLHAKMIEVVCAKGRLLVTGSANATSAGLLRGGPSFRNIEVCTLRTDPRVQRGWTLKPAKAPGPPLATLEDEDDEGDDGTGVLVAAHSQKGIEGRILTSWTAPEAIVTLEVNRRPLQLGTIAIGTAGRFLIPIYRFEDELSLEGRIQLRLEHQGARAEGFVAAPDFGAIRTRAGATLGSMLAILKNLHTTEDAAAVMEFFRVHPEALRTKVSFRTTATRGDAEPDERLIDATLVGRHVNREREAGPGNDGEREELAWQRFVARLLQAFRRARLSHDDGEADDDDADRGELKRREREAAARARLQIHFPELLHTLSGGIEDDAQLSSLFALTQFVCVTTAHPLTKALVERLLVIAEDLALGEEAAGMCGWCLAYIAATQPLTNAAITRARMLKMGLDPARRPDEAFTLPGLRELIVGPDADLAAVFAAVGSARTVHEEIRALEAGLQTDGIPEDLPFLTAHEVWPELERQCAREPGRRRIQFVDRPVSACGKCHIGLLPHQAAGLQRTGICETECHGFILARYP